MLKKIFFIAALAIIFTACKQKNAFNYSQEIVKKETALLPSIEKTEENVAQWIEKNNYDSVVQASNRMVEKIQNVIDEIKKAPAPDAVGGDAFKAASLRYFEYMKNIYVSYANFGKAKSDDERTKSLSDMMAVVEKKQSVIDDMQNSQKQFAKANGFKIEGDEKAK